MVAKITKNATRLKTEFDVGKRRIRERMVDGARDADGTVQVKKRT
jgi:hypothetical protein